MTCFKSRTSFCLILVLLIACKVNGGKYTVVGPGTIYSEGQYTATVATHQNTEPCQIKVGLHGPSYNESQIVQLQGNEVKNVDFQLPSLEEGDYNLTAEGLDCIDHFHNTTKLNYAKFRDHVRIQTDKGLYKPGDVINYRVVFLDKDLKPGKPDKDALIWFEDGKRNRIKEIRHFEVVKGVHTGKFHIPEHPMTGNWKLSVYNGDLYNRQAFFQVDKYVLPKFVVKVESTNQVSVRDGDMQVVVKANYTYGKPLNGQVTVLVNIGSFYYYRNLNDNNNDKNVPTIIRTAKMVQGKAKLNVNVKEFEGHLHSKTSPIFLNIVATVEEEFTGAKINGTDTATLYPYRYAMNCVSYSTCSTFHSNAQENVTFQITYVDGSHLNDTKTPVELMYKEILEPYRYWYGNGEPLRVSAAQTERVSDNRTFVYTSYMNETGFVTFTVSLASLPEYKYYSHYYNLQLKYRDEDRNLYNAYEYKKPKTFDPPVTTHEQKPRDYFYIELKNYNVQVQVNEETTFVINSSQPLPYLIYNVIGRGNVLESGRIDLPQQPKFYHFKLWPKQMWVPTFSLYVYYINETGDFHHAEQRVYMQNKLLNSLNISAPEQVSPGADVNLTIRTAPNSFVGLMAIDQSVLLLRTNNDFSSREFDWLLGVYSTNTPYQGGYSYYPGTNSGVVTLTNANYIYNRTKPRYHAEHSIVSSARPQFAIQNDQIFYKTGMMGASAGHAAFAPSPSAFGLSNSLGETAQVQVRKDFSETWIFDNIENTPSEEFVWSKKIPDTITSWLITGFSMNAEKGVAVTEDRRKLTTFKPFFISVRLPYSVKRGEVIKVPALVFNYLNKSLDVEITLDNGDQEYEFMDISNEILEEQQRVKRMVRVHGNSAAGVSFMLRPKIIGNIMLKYIAVSPIAGDAVHKSLKVVPEGLTHYKNKAVFVNLKNTTQMQGSIALDLPESDLVPDSQYVTVNAIGNLLGPVFNNLNKLVQKPTGCGEQTMSKLLPNYLVKKYLKESNKLTTSLDRTLQYNLESGYQNMLNFQLPNGSFVVFAAQRYGEHVQVNGSTWLTGYVIRSLQQINEFVNVDGKIIESGLEYLAKQQVDNGTFLDPSLYYNFNREPITLTSTVLLAFLENKTVATKYSKVVGKAVEFIAQNIDSAGSLRSQAIGAYALQKAGHAKASEQLTKLESLAEVDGDHKWWSNNKQKPSNAHIPFFGSIFDAYDVESTSYILLMLLEQQSGQASMEELLSIVKWLIAQRNSLGGFYSTQDTILGLTALIEFAKRTQYEVGRMTVHVMPHSQPNKREAIEVTEENDLLLQSVEMPAKTKEVDFAAQGSGAALVQVSYQYNTVELEPKPSFSIKTEKHESSLSGHLLIDICVEYTGDGAASNMAILEVSLPSGFIIEEDSLPELHKVLGVSNTELKNAASKLLVYFNHLYKNDEKCLAVEAFRSHAVALLKPASLVLYDYYDTTKRATSFYSMSSKLCDICDGHDECSKCK